MLSRVGDSLYWMSRYLERAEHTARLLDVHHNLTLELFPEQERQRFRRVLEALQVPAERIAEGGLPTPEELTFDPLRGESVAASINSARENARQIREQISSEMFVQVNRLFLHMRDPRVAESYAVEPHRIYQHVKESSQLFQGITDSTMTHGQGWQFIQIGRYLERAGSTASLIDGHLLPLLGADSTESYLESLGLLKSCTAWEAYCKVYSAELEPQNMLRFLLFSREFPHALHFCVEQLVSAFKGLAERTGNTSRSGLEPGVGRLQADLRYTPVEEIGGSPGEPVKFLARVRHTLKEAHTLLHRLYLSDHWERSHLSW